MRASGSTGRLGRLGIALQSIDQRQKPPFGVFHRLRLSIAKAYSLAVFPQGFERADDCGDIDRLQEAAKTLALRLAVHRIRGVINIAVEFFGKKLGECAIGKIEDIPTTHSE